MQYGFKAFYVLKRVPCQLSLRQVGVNFKQVYRGISDALIQWKSSVETQEENAKRKHFPKNTSPERPCGQLVALCSVSVGWNTLWAELISGMNSSHYYYYHSYW